MNIIASSSHRITRTNFFENLHQLRTIKIMTLANKFRVFNHDDRIGTVRHRSTSHDANRGSIQKVNITRCSGGDFSDNPQRHRLSYAGPASIYGTYGVTVNR
jgi:hypothetical protein